MMDGNPGPVKDEQTEETTEQSTTDYSCVKGFIAGVIVTLVIVFLALQFNSTNEMKIPEIDMIPGMLDGVCTTTQLDLIKNSILNNCYDVDCGSVFTYYDITIYEGGYKGSDDHIITTVGFHWSYSEHDFVLDEFKWHAACPCGCDICTIGGYER